MYRKFSVKNFRGFDYLTAEGLGRINLIAGQNNVGKTALLEALWVHSGPTDPARILRLDSARDLGRFDPESSIDNLFFNFDQSLTIELTSQTYGSSGQRHLKISVQDNPNFETPLDIPGDEQLDSRPSVSQNQIVMEYSDEFEEESVARGWLVERESGTGFRTVGTEKARLTGLQMTKVGFLRSRRRTSGLSDSNQFSQLEVAGQEDKILSILQEIEPRLKRLVVVSVRQRPALYANIGLRRLITVRLMGDGMSHVLSLALTIANSPGG